MAVSNSFDFNLTRDQLIAEAMERIGVLRLNKTPSADHVASAARSLNLKMKALQADGLQLFTYRDAFLFLALNQNTYRLGPAGDRAAESYVKTLLTVNNAAGVDITVESVTGISVGYRIGVELDSGALEWKLVNAIAGNLINLSSALSGPASIGNYVFAYATTAQIERPLAIADPFLRSINDIDTSVDLYSISEYREMSSKLSTGQVVSVAFDPQMTNARLLVWPAVSDVTDVLGFVYKKPVDDMDAAADNPAFPVDWQEYLVCELAAILADKFSLPLGERQHYGKRAKEARFELWDSEDTTIQIVPGR
jgi:hypothetical protein